MSFDYTEKRIQLMREMHKVAIESQTFKSCINCGLFDFHGEICSLNKEHPPAEIIVYGCELHEFDIPF